MADIQPPDIGSLVHQMAQQFISTMSVVLATVDSAVVEIARVAYVTVLLVGVLLYFTHLEKRLGKDLIKGGVVLAVLSEFVFPAISRL
ncbi:MAG: hypothetical protein HY297_04955 [Thaumarchaeota archaeon]|nr:hypothetical protein [Nitrososphaerota archaeon]